MLLDGKQIVVGVTGGIAAYKACELVRLLKKRGNAVRVVMTRSACEFVSPLSFQALSHAPVRTTLFDDQAEAGMSHIELARWADVILIAPASADFMARLAHGRADDLLATLVLASEAPLVLAPAMNWAMWQHPATRSNAALLKSRGVLLLGPALGALAENEVGLGRMLEPGQIVEALEAESPGPLQGTRVLISAGPTREAVDAVRYLSNRSSGRMGFAVADAARRAGAEVTLVAGPVSLPTPAGVTRIDVESAEDMHQAVMARAPSSDIYIGVAAVADYRVPTPSPRKQKRDRNKLVLELEPNPDILAAVAALDNRPFTVGFAAETEALEQNARLKLTKKGADMIAANLVAGDTGGFDNAHNALTVFWSEGSRHLPTAPKPELARQLVDLVATRYKLTQKTNDAKSA